jgi:hypothetical protein
MPTGASSPNTDRERSRTERRSVKIAAAISISERLGTRHEQRTRSESARARCEIGSGDVNAAEIDALLEVVTRNERPRTNPDDRVTALEDRRAIRDLIMVYGYLCDARRWDDLLALYTDDIERVLAGSLTERVRGKAALREKLVSPTLERTDGDGAAPPPEYLVTLRLRHLMASDVIRLSDDGTSATAAVQYTMVATAEDERGFRRGSHEGSYVFDFRKEDGVWRFSRQLVTSDNAHNPMFQREST